MSVSIDYECEISPAQGLDGKELAVLTAEKVLELENCPVDVSISLVVTDENSIREVNREFRNQDRPTDVLSFPAVNFPAPADWEALEEEGDFDPQTGQLLLGDIMICLDRAVAQAREYGHSLRREFAFLVAHSVLHLIGYDHLEPEEAADMEARQERALQALGITRE